MKGVINKGIQELVETQFGEETWESIRREANCDEPAFSPALDYPDQLTLDLVTAASRQLNLSAEDVMIEFGKYWAPNTGKECYPALFAMAGSNVKQFLQNVDRVHRQVTASIVGARPPVLATEVLPDGRLAIHYRSERKLCPVVHGLILGVGVHFDQELSVVEKHCSRNGDEECVFEVTFS